MPVQIYKLPDRPPTREVSVEHIEIVKTMMGSPDGNTVNRYVAGKTYLMPEGLAAVFVREKWGQKVDAPKDPEGEGNHPAPKKTDNEREADEDGDVDNGTLGYNVVDANGLIAEEEDVDSLRALRRGEEQHPDFNGGRIGVLDAIDVRLAELEDE